MFRGVGTAIVTPFKNGEVDYQAYGKLVEWQIESGVSAIIVAGTTGEGATLTEEERTKLTQITKEICNGKAKVIVGTGTNDTQKTLKFSKLAENDGADGVLIVTPYYNKPTQGGLYEHYRYLAERLSIPIIVYNVPSRTGVNISPETVVKLAKDFKNIIGLKEANADVNQADEVIRLLREENLRFYVWSGNDDRTLHMISAGCDGVISVVSNALPKEMVELVNYALSSDFPKAREIHYKLLPAMKLFFIETNPIPVKAFLHLLGNIENELRLPLVSATNSTIEKLKNLIENLKKEGVSV